LFTDFDLGFKVVLKVRHVEQHWLCWALSDES